MSGERHPAKKTYRELEVGLHRTETAVGSYVVELRFSDPGSDAEVAPERGPAVLDAEALRTLHFDPAAYGRKLAAGLFEAPNVRDLWTRARAVTEADGGFLRVCLLVGPSALELHALRWELLADPESGDPLATSERTPFSRFMMSRDWRPVRLRPKTALRGLVAVAAPSDIERYKLAAADVEGEIRRARENLGDVDVRVAGGEEPLTLDGLLEELRGDNGAGIDILYLVCHGLLTREHLPVLLLQDEDGTAARVRGEDLARGVAELQSPPRLVFLASCQSARQEENAADESGRAAAESALAPRLAEAGVPAIVAMQGNISMATVDAAMPTFFRELMKDGQIDRAMAVARARVRDRGDAWMPALYLRLKSGRIWYVPGFAGEGDQFKKWQSILNSVATRTVVPILGPVLDERIQGARGVVAENLAERCDFPFTGRQRRDLAKVTQYLSVKESRTFAATQLLRETRRELLKLHPELKRDGIELKDIYKEVVKKRALLEDDPFRILASLDSSVYICTSFDPLLPLTLAESGAKPKLLFGEWRKTHDSHPEEPAYQGTPDKENPVVHYPFGFIAKPDTLVFTEDDYVDYLIAAVDYKLMPGVVRGTVIDSSLLFLGFSLDDWSFRILFRLLMSLDGSAQLSDYAHVGVQVDPTEENIGNVEQARAYLEAYLGAGRDAPRIDIYWGTAADFLQELQSERRKVGRETVIRLGDDAGEEDEWISL